MASVIHMNDERDKSLQIQEPFQDSISVGEQKKKKENFTVEG
jgi:hypothetical protein